MQTQQKPNIVNCSQCGGKGSHYITLRDKGGKSNHGCGESYLVTCMKYGCENGKVDLSKPSADYPVKY